MDEGCDFTVSGSLKPEVKYVNKIYKDMPQEKLQKGYMYSIKFPEQKKDFVYFADSPDTQFEYNENSVPAWCRREIKRQKRDWRALHKQVKNVQLYSGDLFPPLPAVKDVSFDTQARKDE